MSPFRTLPSSSAAASRSSDLAGWEVFQVSGDEKLSLNFDQGSTRHTQKVMELFLRKASLSFCDIAWYRDGRSPQLIGESVTLLARKSLSHFVDLGDELHGLLPCDQITVGTAHSASKSKLSNFYGRELCDRRPNKMFGFTEN